MSIGKTLRIYLVDGAPAGMLTAEIMNWTGKVIVFARSQLGDAAKRDEVHRTGVYFLGGTDPENPLRDWVYVGEADDVLKRLAIHSRDERRDFWERTVVVVSKDENLTKAHVRYLESRLIHLARGGSGTCGERDIPADTVVAGAGCRGHGVLPRSDRHDAARARIQLS